MKYLHIKNRCWKSKIRCTSSQPAFTSRRGRTCYLPASKVTLQRVPNTDIINLHPSRRPIDSLIVREAWPVASPSAERRAGTIAHPKHRSHRPIPPRGWRQSQRAHDGRCLQQVRCGGGYTEHDGGPNCRSAWCSIIGSNTCLAP